VEIKFKNSAYAMKARQLLNRAGFRTSVGKRSGEDGCYYYIYIPDKFYERVEEILEKEGLL
jgi:hypothetical protein